MRAVGTLFQTSSHKSPSDMRSKSTKTKKQMAVESKLRVAREQFKYDEEIRNLELARKVQQAENEAKLDLLKSKKKLATAEAMASVYDDESDLVTLDEAFESELDPPLDPVQSTQNWVNTQETPGLHDHNELSRNPTRPNNSSLSIVEELPIKPPLPRLETKIHFSTPRNAPAADYQAIRDQSMANPREYNFRQQPFEFELQQQEINKKLVASLTKQSLPKCEPDEFTGNAALFLPWKIAFKNLIAEADASPDQELTYHLKYTSGKPKDLVNSFRKRAHPDSRVKLELLWSTLEERFGHNSEVTNSLIENLMKASNFKAEDRESLQTFYDICEDLKSQIPYLKGLHILNTSYFMKTLTEKLPRPIREKWENRVSKFMVSYSHEDYPPFSLFVETVRDISIRKNHPAIVKVNSSKDPDFVDTSRNWSRSTMKTLKTEVSSSYSGEEVCILHPDAKHQHTLQDCRVFAGKTYEEKVGIVRDAELCFRCLKGKHFSKSCTEDVRCPTCNMRHFQAMHRDVETKGPLLQSGESVTSTRTKIFGNVIKEKSCGKTVLVDIFHKTRPTKPLRTYVTVDDQSNHTLGSTELFETLQLAGENQPYTLETCHGKESCYGRRATNLVIRNLNGDVFPLPTVIESNNIPEDKSEIPIPQVIEKIPHLRSIARLLPQIDNKAKVTLIIGRDASDLLKVRESINGPKGAAWAQRLDLGWTVSGDLCLDRQGGRVHTAVEQEFESIENKMTCREKIIAPTELLRRQFPRK